MKKRILTLALCLVMALSLLPGAASAASGTAYEVVGGNIYYDAKGTITGCDSSVTAADIPSWIDNILISTIGEGAFAGCKNLTTLIIPSSLSTIKANAFANCTALTSVVIPTNCTLDMSAFDGCTALTAIHTSDQRTPNETVSKYSSVDGILYDKQRTVLYRYPMGKKDQTAYEVRSGVTTIASGAFAGSSLTAVCIPVSLKTVEAGAFADCSELTDVYFVGREEQWGVKVDESGNSAFLNAKLHYSSKLPADIAPVIADAATLRQALEYLKVHKTDIIVTNDTVDNVGVAKAMMETLKPMIPERMEISVFVIDLSYVKKATEEKEGSFYADVYIRSGTRQERQTISSIPIQKVKSAAPAIPATGTAYPTNLTVDVDGKKMTFRMYALKEGNGYINYIRIRDLAYALNGTKAQFGVGWDNESKTSALTTGQPYKANGSENTTPFSGERAYAVNPSTTKVNGKVVDLAGILLKDDAENGYIYCQLKDLGSKLNFNVAYSYERGIYIETDKPYAGTG